MIETETKPVRPRRNILTPARIALVLGAILAFPGIILFLHAQVITPNYPTAESDPRTWIPIVEAWRGIGLVIIDIIITIPTALILALVSAIRRQNKNPEDQA